MTGVKQSVEANVSEELQNRKKGKEMKIIKYSTCFDEDRKPMLVKESSGNYPDICSLNSPDKIFNMMNLVYKSNNLTEEYFWILALNTACKPTGMFEISHGTVNASLVTPREVFMKLLLCGASHFVAIHNHPSGDTTPSKNDIEITKKLCEVGEIMNINLTDHIIVGDCYYSFRENGLC